MKKLLALLIATVLLCVAIVPVSAADTVPEELAQEVYARYMQSRWQEYKTSYEEGLKDIADLKERDPDRYEQIIANYYKTYEEFCAAKPIESFDEYGEFSYLGSFHDGEISIWIVEHAHAMGIRGVFVGDYWMGDGCVYGGLENQGVVVYADEKLTYLPDAYEQGIIDDTVLQTLCEKNYSIGCVKKGFRRVGDMDDSNSLDVADIIGTKDNIMNLRDDDFSGETYRSYADFDKNGYVDVGDIVALKNHIMSK